MKVHWQRELQYFLLAGAWNAEKLHISWRNSKRWYETRSSVIICFYCCLRRLDTPRESAKYNLWQEFSINIQCSPCILLGCVFIMAKISLGRTRNQSEGNEPRYRYLSSGIQLNVWWIKRYPFQINFLTTLNLSTASEDIRSPNTNSSLTRSRWKVKFSSNLSGSPTSFG